jgi:tetratricopeptide (TPR) repeat protein
MAAARTLQRADMFRTSGDLTQALSLYREVLRLDPANSAAAQAIVRIRMEYLLRRARSLVEGEDYDAALKDLDAVAGEDPGNPDAEALRKEIAAARSGAPRKPKGPDGGSL